MLITIPENILPKDQFSEEELLLELAIALYASSKISLGQARRLAGIDWFSFRKILSDRNIPSNYDEKMLEKDIEVAKSFPNS